jgi:hypothetical protein
VLHPFSHDLIGPVMEPTDVLMSAMTPTELGFLAC